MWTLQPQHDCTWGRGFEEDVEVKGGRDGAQGVAVFIGQGSSAPDLGVHSGKGRQGSQAGERLSPHPRPPFLIPAGSRLPSHREQVSVVEAA